MNLLKALSPLAVLGVAVAMTVAPPSALSAETGGLDARFKTPDSQTWRQSERPLSGRTIAVLVANDFNAVEAFYPIYRWREAGARIVLVGAAETE